MEKFSFGFLFFSGIFCCFTLAAFARLDCLLLTPAAVAAAPVALATAQK